VVQRRRFAADEDLNRVGCRLGEDPGGPASAVRRRRGSQPVVREHTRCGSRVPASAVRRRRGSQR